MDYRITETGGHHSIAISGSLSYRNASAFDEIIAELGRHQSSGFVFQLDQVEHIDSTALGFFVHAYDVAQKKNIKVSIKGAQPTIKKLMEIAEFDKLMELG